MVEWIAVADRLPEAGARVLVCIGDENQLELPYWIDFAHFFPDLEEFNHLEFMGLDRPGFVKFNPNSCSYFEVTVRYWQPVPEPPVK